MLRKALEPVGRIVDDLRECIDHLGWDGHRCCGTPHHHRPDGIRSVLSHQQSHLAAIAKPGDAGWRAREFIDECQEGRRIGLVVRRRVLPGLRTRLARAGKVRGEHGVVTAEGLRDGLELVDALGNPGKEKEWVPFTGLLVVDLVSGVLEPTHGHRLQEIAMETVCPRAAHRLDRGPRDHYPAHRNARAGRPALCGETAICVGGALQSALGRTFGCISAIAAPSYFSSTLPGLMHSTSTEPSAEA